MSSPATEPVPLALYVHLPWCIQKCPYCDFNSHPGTPNQDRQSSYVDALIRDLTFELAGQPAEQPITSVFFGGGTPSLFEPLQIERILTTVDQRLGLTKHCEITLEANPGAVEADRFRGFRQAGVNRISLGIQSFDDEQLKRLGRVHDADQARRAIQAAVDAGFERFNLDLMYGLPQQTVESALADLDAALQFEPRHLSWYQLTLEPNTAFFRQPPSLPDSDKLADIQMAGIERLQAAGLQQYEVSAWAVEGQECQHNLNYWQFGDYLGVGAGAHAKRCLPDGRLQRRSRMRSPDRYLALAGSAACITEERVVTGGDLLFEYLLNVLRLKAGVDLLHCQQHTGWSPEQVLGRLESPLSHGLLVKQGQKLLCSPRGWELLDSILSDLLPN